MTAEDKMCTLSYESGLTSIHKIDFLYMCSEKSTFPTRKKGCCHIQFENHGNFKIQSEPVSVDVQRKGNEFNISILVTLIYKSGCCVHLRLLTAVENNFTGVHYINVMDCNGTVTLMY